MVGESGAMICINSTRDKILPYFNRENRSCSWSKILEMIPYSDKGLVKGKAVITVV